jgi:hypothetical protein
LSLGGVSPLTLPTGRRILAAGIGLAARSCSPVAQATENGLVDWPAGALTVYAGLLPPPGQTQLQGYFAFYDATSFRDNAGRPVPGLRASLAAQAPRFVHTWSQTLGPFQFGIGGDMEWDYAKVKQFENRDEAVGVDILGIEPLNITTHWRDLYFMAGTEIYVPIGPYHPNRLANTSTHHLDVVPMVSVTWLPNPRWEFSGNGVVEFHMRNNATGYHSGDVLIFTCGMGDRPFAGHQAWELGLSGYYDDQFTDDTSHGVHVPDGNHLRKIAVGPKIVYWLSPSSAVVAQIHHEMAVRNAFRGDLYWIEFAVPP